MGRVINYKEKICIKCNQTFKPTSGTQKICEKCLTKVCLYCGNKYKTTSKEFDTTKFCSRKCQGKYTSKYLVGENSKNFKEGNYLKTVELICNNCNKSFKRVPAEIKEWKTQFCGRKCQVEYYKKHNEQFKGENSPVYSQVDVRCDWCGKIYKNIKSTQNRTRFCSKECRNNWQSEMMKGEKHYNWNNGSSQKRHLDMSRREYKNWRRQVFERDNYTCQICGDNKGGNLNAHHIKPYKDYPELRYDEKNGITLCEKCHRDIHSKIIELDIQSDLTQ